MWDGNPVIDGLLIIASLVVGCALVWEAIALFIAHVGGGPIWRLTVSELVLRYPVFGLVLVLSCTYVLGWITGHWFDLVRTRRA